jgi:hypothetical protein
MALVPCTARELTRDALLLKAFLLPGLPMLR